MAVRSELVRETIVERICERVTARLPRDLPKAVAGVLDRSEPAATLARAGYLTRVAETELFDAARSPMPGLADSLRACLEQGSPWGDAVADTARELASREPLERPEPDDPDAASWRVPGPGGHVRHYVARRFVAEREAALKRDFVYGFLVRCCEEALSPY